MFTSTQIFFIWGLLLYLIGSLPNLHAKRDQGFAANGIVTALVILLILWLVLGHSHSVRQVGRDAESDFRNIGEDAKQDAQKVTRDVQRGVQ